MNREEGKRIQDQRRGKVQKLMTRGPLTEKCRRQWLEFGVQAWIKKKFCAQGPVFFTKKLQKPKKNNEQKKGYHIRKNTIRVSVPYQDPLKEKKIQVPKDDMMTLVMVKSPKMTQEDMTTIVMVQCPKMT